MDNRVARQLCDTQKTSARIQNWTYLYIRQRLYMWSLGRNPQAQPKETPNFPSPPSPILKRTTPSPTVPVTFTSTPIDEENIICIEDKTIWAQQEKEQRRKTSSPSSPPKTAPATAMTDEDEEITECPSTLPEDLYVIKEFIQHDKDNDYIPLLSAITLKEKKRMIFLPVDFNTVKICLSRLRCVH